MLCTKAVQNAPSVPHTPEWDLCHCLRFAHETIKPRQQDYHQCLYSSSTSPDIGERTKNHPGFVLLRMQVTVNGCWRPVRGAGHILPLVWGVLPVSNRQWLQGEGRVRTVQSTGALAQLYEFSDDLAPHPQKQAPSSTHRPVTGPFQGVHSHSGFCLSPWISRCQFFISVIKIY